jgi:hypothetical protein
VQIPVQHTQDTNEQTKKGEDHTQNTTDDGDWWDRVWKSTDDNILDTIKDMYNYIQLSMGAFEVFSGMGVREFGMDFIKVINSAELIQWIMASAAAMITGAAGVGLRAATFVLPKVLEETARQGQSRMYRPRK